MGQSSQFLRSIATATIYIMSVACYQDKHQLNSMPTDQSLHNLLGKECFGIICID